MGIKALLLHWRALFTSPLSVPVVAPDSEIWFLDQALYWHFLTKSFTAYYRLLITNLGLPQWQYAFTSYGISPQAKVRESATACPVTSQGFTLSAGKPLSSKP